MRQEPWIEFREALWNALALRHSIDPVEHPGYGYGDEDRSTHACPVCGWQHGEYLLVTFDGRSPRADVRCSRGCAAQEVADALRLELNERGQLVPRETPADLQTRWWVKVP